MAAAGLEGLVPYVVNFSIVVGAAVYFGREPLRRYVYQRHEKQKDLLESAKKAKTDAEKRYQEIVDSLSALNQKSSALIAEKTQDAEAVAKEILERAKADASRLAQDADRIIANERAEKEYLLKQELLKEAVSRAEKKLRSGMKSEDHTALIKRAKIKIEGAAV